MIGSKKNYTNYFIYGELGRVPLQVNIFHAIIKFWFKILESDKANYIRYAYELMFVRFAQKTKHC